MFTQCPECGSVFRVTADALKIAAGLVRCGVCQHRFDALAALTDDPGAPATGPDAPADDGAPPPFDDTITVEELGAGEVIELGAANDDAVAADDGAILPLPTDTEAEPHPADAPEPGHDDDAADWMPENQAPAAIDDTDRAGRGDDTEAASDAFEVNDSSVTGLEAIILDGDGQPMRDPSESVVDAEPATDERASDAAAPGDVDAQAAAADLSVPPAAGPADDLEFHGSEADLERVFVATDAPVHAATPAHDAAPTPDEAPAAVSIEALFPELLEVRDLPELAGDAPQAGATAAAPAAAVTPPVEAEPTPPTAPGRPDLDQTDEFPILVLDERDEAQANFSDAGDRTAAADDEEQAAEPDDASSTAAAAAAGATLAAGAGAIPVMPLRAAHLREDEAADSAAARLAIPEHLRRGRVVDDSGDDGDLRFGLDDGTPRWWERRAVWLAGSVLLALTLLAQVVHYNREALSRNATLGPWVLRTYTLLGLPAPIPSDLSALELHQWGAATDARAAGRLRLRASLVNRAPFAQPYPVLRVTLHDRFGNVLGSRDVGARDYLPGGAPQRRLLATGQRLDAEIVVVDPGADAVGYEIDLCEERRDGVRCLDTTRSPS